MKIGIVGGGASGLMCGGLLSKKHQVTIFDGNEKCGKKIYITGKGRCNLTNDCDKETYLNSVVRGKKFMQSAISKFTPEDCKLFFEERGLKLKVERGARVFPLSDKASDVTKTLEKECKNAEIKLGEKAVSVGKDLTIKTEKAEYKFDKIIIATGGKSYSATGSSGDGYNFAKSLGHKIVEIKPALVAIKIKDKVLEMQGLPLKNVTLTAIADGKKIEQFGEMMFTDIGITGPIVLTMSSYINRAKKVELYIDLKPALDEQTLDARLLREFEDNKNKTIYTVLRNLLPKNFIDFFLSKLGFSGQEKINSIKAGQRKSLLQLLKRFPLEYNGLYPIDTGIITSGGVELSEVNPSTMESKLCKGIYFIGEVLDIDCLTGGFNLQSAFATAYACAMAINKEGT